MVNPTCGSCRKYSMKLVCWLCISFYLYCARMSEPRTTLRSKQVDLHEIGMDDYIFFNDIHESGGFLSHWYPSTFRDLKNGGDEYSCVGQYILAEKARLFGDESTLRLIMNASGHAEMKRLEGRIQNVDEKLWGKRRFSIATQGNRFKFCQNPSLGRRLFNNTGGAVLVEASPDDKVYGSGTEKRTNKFTGLNLCGKAIMQVRQEVRQCKLDVDGNLLQLHSEDPPASADA